MVRAAVFCFLWLFHSVLCANEVDTVEERNIGDTFQLSAVSTGWLFFKVEVPTNRQPFFVKFYADTATFRFFLQLNVLPTEKSSMRQAYSSFSTSAAFRRGQLSVSSWDYDSYHMNDTDMLVFGLRSCPSYGCLSSQWPIEQPLPVYVEIHNSTCGQHSDCTTCATTANCMWCSYNASGVSDGCLHYDTTAGLVEYNTCPNGPTTAPNSHLKAVFAGQVPQVTASCPFVNPVFLAVGTTNVTRTGNLRVGEWAFYKVNTFQKPFSLTFTKTTSDSLFRLYLRATHPPTSVTYDVRSVWDETYIALAEGASDVVWVGIRACSNAIPLCVPWGGDAEFSFVLEPSFQVCLADGSSCKNFNSADIFLPNDGLSTDVTLKQADWHVLKLSPPVSTFFLAVKIQMGDVVEGGIAVHVSQGTGPAALDAVVGEVVNGTTLLQRFPESGFTGDSIESHVRFDDTQTTTWVTLEGCPTGNNLQCEWKEDELFLQVFAPSHQLCRRHSDDCSACISRTNSWCGFCSDAFMADTSCVLQHHESFASGSLHSECPHEDDFWTEDSQFCSLGKVRVAALVISVFNLALIGIVLVMQFFYFRHLFTARSTQKLFQDREHLFPVSNVQARLAPLVARDLKEWNDYLVPPLWANLQTFLLVIVGPGACAIGPMLFIFLLTDQNSGVTLAIIFASIAFFISLAALSGSKMFKFRGIVITSARVIELTSDFGDECRVNDCRWSDVTAVEFRRKPFSFGCELTFIKKGGRVFRIRGVRSASEVESIVRRNYERICHELRQEPIYYSNVDQYQADKGTSYLPPPDNWRWFMLWGHVLVIISLFGDVLWAISIHEFTDANPDSCFHKNLVTVMYVFVIVIASLCVCIVPACVCCFIMSLFVRDIQTQYVFPILQVTNASVLWGGIFSWCIMWFLLPVHCFIGVHGAKEWACLVLNTLLLIHCVCLAHGDFLMFDDKDVVKRRLEEKNCPTLPAGHPLVKQLRPIDYMRAFFCWCFERHRYQRHLRRIHRQADQAFRIPNQSVQMQDLVNKFGISERELRTAVMPGVVEESKTENKEEKEEEEEQKEGANTKYNVDTFEFGPAVHFCDGWKALATSFWKWVSCARSDAPHLHVRARDTFVQDRRERSVFISGQCISFFTSAVVAIVLVCILQPSFDRGAVAVRGGLVQVGFSCLLGQGDNTSIVTVGEETRILYPRAAASFAFVGHVPKTVQDGVETCPAVLFNLSFVSTFQYTSSFKEYQYGLEGVVELEWNTSANAIVRETHKLRSQLSLTEDQWEVVETFVANENRLSLLLNTHLDCKAT